MVLRNIPSSLYNLALQIVSKSILQHCKESYNINYYSFSTDLRNNVGNLLPFTIYDEVFDLIVESHARVVQNERRPSIENKSRPGIVTLIGSLINPIQRKLKLSCLRHIGVVLDEDIVYLESILLNELPILTNLVDICLQTSGTDSTLPTCNDEILDKIGLSCPNLKNLDISYNYTVTDSGLYYILPSEFRIGCPVLVKLSIFECSVSTKGIVSVLKGIHTLKFLGFRETGECLLSLAKENTESIIKLKLAHVNNLGFISRTCKDVGKLSCNEKLVNAIYTCCPKLNGLKVRIDDSNVILLKKINTISILELVYNLGSSKSPGNGTVQYLNICGVQLVSLSFVCNTFTTKHLKVVCEQCINLKRLWIRTNTFECDQDITDSDRKNCSLSSLEVFFFRVGWYGSEDSHIPHNVISYILHKSSVLKEIVIAMINRLYCDSFIDELFSSIQTAHLKELMILVPEKNFRASTLNLTLSSVEVLIRLCPQLQKLGNLLVWDVSLEEIQELRRHINLSNSALDLIYRIMCA